MDNWQKYAAELVGTLILVGMGTGTILAALATQTALQAAVPLGFGLALLVALYAVGDVSGGHFNPAVTFAMFLNRDIKMQDMIGYWVAQIVGAVGASWFVAILVSREGVGRTATTSSVAGFQTFFGEALFTAVFVLLILSVVKSAKHSGSAYFVIAVGLSSVHYFGVPFTGASVNPARSLGPLLIGDHVSNASDIWIYIVAPLVGAAIGWLVWRVVVQGDTDMGDALSDAAGRFTE